MAPIDLLTNLTRRGLRVRHEAGNLHVGPRELLTDELRAQLRRHKLAMIELLRVPGIEVLIDILMSFDGQIVRATPRGPLTVGPYIRCPRHPAIGTWQYDQRGRPVCALCRDGKRSQHTRGPLPLSRQLLSLCARKHEVAKPLFVPVRAPIEEQVWAALHNGPKSPKQIALELDVPVSEVLRLLNQQLDTAGPDLQMSELPEVDPATEKDDGSGDMTPDHERL
jgi:hypothetical protein